MDSSEITTKSSNEILTELFGAFNAKPPEIEVKSSGSSSDETETKPKKKSKKPKSKKSKKKHKSKSKKHKKKRHEAGSSDSSSVKLKKKKKNKVEKKHKSRHDSPPSVNIELPVDKVPLALEIKLDGTVGIKGEDGVITEIPDKKENESDSTNDISENNCFDNVDESTKTEGEKLERVINKTDNELTVVNSKILQVFEVDAQVEDSSEKLKKGKIQIKDLKFSSVFQETVKAVEEQKKKEEEKKANYEEGELSESSEDERDKSDNKDNLKHRSEKESSRHKSRNSSHHRRRDSEHSNKRRRSSSHHRSSSRHHSKETSCHKRHRSRSREHYEAHYSRNGHTRDSPSTIKSHHSRERHRSRSRSRHKSSRSIERRKSKSSHRSRSRESKHSSRLKVKDRSKSVEKIDKEKLLAIARKNALKLIDAGVVPGSEKMTALKAGGKTVNELTEYCKKLSEKEALGDDVSDIESSSSEDEEKPFHHPFQVRDRPSSIIMNIKNSIPLPVKSLQEKAAEQAKQLRLQFPVSSGSSHRRTESEWVPVSPPKKEEPIATKLAMPVALPPPVENSIMPPPQPHPVTIPTYFSAVPPPEPISRPVFPVIQPHLPMSKLDISSIVSKRLEAIRKLQENPNDPQALNQMYSAQQEMQYWAESKQETGAFTGSTGAKILSASELSSGAQAWARRDQLTSATPVKGGMGMALLQKMGWQPGEGLGKNKEGTLEPLKLEVKMDKKGLVAPDENKRNRRGNGMMQGPPMPSVTSLDGKHPVSLLNELCSRRRYGVPQFELCFECGPDHKKNFLFKVKVNGIDYKPTVASPNKKQAKAEAASVCLRALGILPSNP